MSDSNDDFNSAKWVADFATQFLQNNLEKIYGKGKQLLKSGTDEIRLLTEAYTDYLSCVAERYSQTRSFLMRDESIDLLKFYVPLGTSCSDKTIPQASIRTLITNKRFAIITGSGGSGKSMMMRYLFLDAIKSKEKVPIFVELRDVNDSDKTIVELVKRTLTVNKFGFDDEYIEKALKAGLFAILLDGYDEVVNAKRKQVANEIERLTQDYDQNYIIVSSRPDLEFSGWHPFKVCEISPLTLEQACELLVRAPGDKELKAKFIKDLQEKLFEEHESFLSNPLLLSIMLLTYKDNAEIPKKLSIFYQQAYEALFNRHDALKGTWQREHATDLDIQDFARVFSAYSLLTYDKRVTSFSPTEAVEYLNKSKQLKSVEFKPEDYLTDAKKAVCLLVDDGQYLSYSHRSFQEYFTARFIAEAAPDKQKLLIAKYASSILSDRVVYLLYNINPELVEQSYIIPELERLEKDYELENEVELFNYSRLMCKMCNRVFKFEDRLGFDLNAETGTYQLWHFTAEICGNLVNWKSQFNDTKPSANFIHKWIEDYGNKRYVSMEKIAENSDLLTYLAEGNHFFSVNALKSLLLIKDKLVKKQRQSEKSLNEILGF